MDNVTDEAGRVLVIRRIDALTRRRWTGNCGAKADIDRWFGEGFLALHVSSIDGVPVILPQTADQTDALVARLAGDDEAQIDWASAVAEVLRARQDRREAQKDAAKNSVGTPSS